MDRAVVEIDEALAPAYEVRRAHAEVCLVALVRRARLPILNSIEWVSRSGIQQLLDPISLRPCPRL